MIKVFSYAIPLNDFEFPEDNWYWGVFQSNKVLRG